MKNLIKLGLVLAFITNHANAASVNANANQIVTAAIAIVKVSDLEFGSAAQGDASKTVAPGSSENSENASFTVTGQPSTAYTITLPVDGTVKMITAGGGTSDTEINVNSFASTPAAGANGLLNGSGTETLFAGATRAALSATQVTGTYTGAFTVTVVY